MVVFTNIIAQVAGFRWKILQKVELLSSTPGQLSKVADALVSVNFPSCCRYFPPAHFLLSLYSFHIYIYATTNMPPNTHGPAKLTCILHHHLLYHHHAGGAYHQTGCRRCLTSSSRAAFTDPLAVRDLVLNAGDYFELALMKCHARTKVNCLVLDRSSTSSLKLASWTVTWAPCAPDRTCLLKTLNPNSRQSRGAFEERTFHAGDTIIGKALRIREVTELCSRRERNMNNCRCAENCGGNRPGILRITPFLS